MLAISHVHNWSSAWYATLKNDYEPTIGPNNARNQVQMKENSDEEQAAIMHKYVWHPVPGEMAEIEGWEEARVPRVPPNR